MRSISADRRRALVVRRHHLDGSGTSPEQIVRSLLALHATDPASVYLSVLARGRDLTIADVQRSMYDDRSLARWMAMRRTLFVFPREDVPVVQAAVSEPLGETLRRALVRDMVRKGTDPAIDGDVDAWLTDVEDGVHAALRARGTATGAQLGGDEPRLRTAILPSAPSDARQNVTSRLLVIMGTDGHLVRGAATGAWTTRQHRWEPIERWWPEGMPRVPRDEARVELVRRYLAAFGPCTVADVEWWTGWTKTAVRAALTAIAPEEIDLHGAPGIVLPGSDLGEAEAETDTETDAAAGGDGPRHGTGPVATLLPTLDPTPMGWKDRDWYFGMDREPLFDRNGNLAATVWWDGEVVGGWASTPTGIRVDVRADRGAEARAAIEAAAAELEPRLEGAVITPVFRTPLERSLTSVSPPTD